MKKALLLFLVFMFLQPANVSSQCVNSFPYNEDFENDNGGWFAAGTGSDWAWGAPTKNAINQAASGNNCWIVGGLTTSFYSFGQRSYVQSPCFDFTNLQRPYVSFSVYWESERQYDGGSFQYSIDGGLTWGNIGYYGKPESCMNENWYNENNVNNLSGMVNITEGWAGNSKNDQGACLGGSGSNGWVRATQCMLGLKGISNVLFRFTFGAGTACNNYDGLAFDNITIGEAPPNTADFTYTCNGNTVNFAGITSQCPDTLLWTFSDGGTTTGLNATYTFSSAGVYTATLYAGGPCNAPATVTRQIEVITASIAGQDASCNGLSDGSATVQVTPPGSYTYTWSTTPPQTTENATNLSAGDYAVTVSSPNACPNILQVSIGEPSGLSRQLSSTPDTCIGGGGTAQLNVSGGTPPYQYNWSNGAAADSLTNLNTGMYTVTTTDADGCSVSDTFNIGYLSGLQIQFSKVKNVSCYDERNGEINATVLGNGALPYTYLWSNNATTASINTLDTGAYSLTVSDANGCSTEDSTTVLKEVCTSYVFFPTGFTPNGDGVNDKFKPKYSQDITKYNVRVYNRWGEMVYEGNDINDGWDGYYKGMLQPLGVYVFVSEYRFGQGKLQQASGNITLLK